ncbi:MAG: DUF4956 domain-containing protein [Bacteroidetes bacterium]|nr:DUF4956 domain-containing protein [Bacteroidota bacterium]
MISKISFRFLIDIISVFILIRFIYFPQYRKRDLYFTYIIFNCIIFLICFLLNKVELSMGAAFGLFAVFSMLRYRTEDVSIKDMTYLFIVIAMGLIASVVKIKGASEKFELIFLAIVNLAVLLIAFLLEGKLLIKTESSGLLIYENIELIHKDKANEMLEDIKNRTGLKVHRFSIQKIDFLKDSATLKIYYYE